MTRVLPRIPVAGLLVAGLVAASFGLAAGRFVGRSHAVASIDASLRRELAHKTEAVESFYDASSTMTALVASNPVFPALLASPDPSEEVRARAAAVLLALDDVMPEASISEACVIDENGHELVRVGDHAATPTDRLSRDEALNVFFKRAIETPVGTVYRAAPYRSPDSGEIVLATAMPFTGNGRRAVVHIEMRAERVRERLAEELRTWVIDARTGITVIDSKTALRPAIGPAIAQPLTIAGPSDTARPFPFHRATERPTVFTVGRRRFAIRALPERGRDDSGLAVVVESSATIGPWTGFSGASTLLVFLGIVSTGAALINRRRARAAQQRSERDELTGLGNRRLLGAELLRRIEAARSTGTGFALAMIDLDEFKEVNDTLGHEAGDQLLVELAERFRRQARSSDVVARLGGDEFAAILSDAADPDAARLAANRLLDVFAAPVDLGDVPVTVRASVGIAVYPTDGTEPSALLRCADVAMYRAKASQQGMASYEAESDPHHPDRLRLLAALREAIELGDIRVVYQPVIDLATGSVRSAEALARWTHPTLGFISPAEFIPLAESFGLMRPLTRLVLRKALTALTAWQSEGLDLSVAVNLSATSLVEADCAQQISRALRANGVDASKLTLEVTESAVIADPRRAQVTLDALHRLGVRLAVDDYGTGNASIGYLRTMPFDVVKIDRSFVSGLLSNRVDRAIIRTTIELSNELDIAVVAEGVETEEELEALRTLGCAMIQGWYYSPALAGPAFVDWVKARNPPESAAAMSASAAISASRRARVARTRVHQSGGTDAGPEPDGVRPLA